MKDELRVIAVVPARGGDHEVPYLNTKKLGPHPLVAYTLIEAGKSRYIDHLVVSTDDDEVTRVASEYGAKVPFRRPAHLASDIPEIKKVIQHAVDFVEKAERIRFDIVVTLQATSPFRTARQIDEAIDTLVDTPVEKGFDSVISLKELRSLTWRMQGGKLKPVFELAGRREELEPLYHEDGAIRVMWRNVLDSADRLGERVGHVLMDKMSALTVHDIYDFWLAERLAHLPRVLFRVDGGGEMGMGHVYRSLAAAHALSKISTNADVCFLMRADRPEGVQFVSQAGRPVRVLADSGANPLSAIRDYSPNVIVNDLPRLDDSYLRSLATLGASTVNFVDTLSDIEKPNEMATVIIAALAEDVELEDYYAGPAFTILRESFQNRASEVSEHGRRVVLTFGGSDPQKLTLKALAALGPLAKSIPQLVVTAVLGPAFSHRTELEELTKKLPYQPRILTHVEHMADLLVEADLVLCSGGMTVLEIAALGRPGLVLCQNAREQARMQRFERDGSIVHLGLGTEIGEETIRERTLELLHDRGARLRMSEAGAKLVDARGAANVAEVLIQAGRKGPANGGRRE